MGLGSGDYQIRAYGPAFPIHRFTRFKSLGLVFRVI